MKLKFSILSIFTALLCALFLTACSGTGTMYRPDDDEETEETASTADTASEQGAPQHGGGAEEAADSQPSNEKPEEEPHAKTTYLGGIGSDLYSVRTVDYYYGFSLEGNSMQLPCAASEIAGAGWKILDSRSDEERTGNTLIAPYSFEFFDAVYDGSAASSDEGTQTASEDAPEKRIRLCLANSTDRPMVPSACMVCGVSASLDSGVSLQTVFGTGTGNTLSDLTAVFGTDDSIYSMTSYSDGTSSLCYRFSNGLAVHEHIPVLAEADEKSLAECLLAETGPDGQTITKLSLYYFRLEEADEEAKKELAAEEATAAAEEAAEQAEEDYYEEEYYYEEPAVKTENKKSKKESSKEKSSVKLQELGPSK